MDENEWNSYEKMDKKESQENIFWCFESKAEKIKEMRKMDLSKNSISQKFYILQ
jgi:predicted GNAT family acetyltransferase